MVAFEYYDGPEFGICAIDGGDMFSYRLIGGSNDELSRAFVLCELNIIWSSVAMLFPELGGVEFGSRRIYVLKDKSAIVTQRVEEIRQESRQGNIIGVGESNLQRLRVAYIKRAELVEIENITNYNTIFEVASNFVRNRSGPIEKK